MYTQKKTIENSRIVRERDRQRFRELLAVFSIGVPVGLFLLLFTWQNLEVIRLGRESTRLLEVRKRLEQKNTELQIEIEKLTALDAVEQKARSLGFAQTASSNVVTITSPAGTTSDPNRPAARPAGEAVVAVLPPAAGGGTR